MRTVLLRTHDKGLIATTLNFDYEVRSAKEAFKEIPDIKIKGEMLDLAKHIIGMKKGTFSAEEFDDRYEAALAELIKAKLEGKTLPKRAPPKVSKPNELLEALRQSAGFKPAAESKRREGKAAAKGRAKATRSTAAKGKTKTAAKSAPAERASGKLREVNDGAPTSILERLPQALARHLPRINDAGDQRIGKGPLPYPEPQDEQSGRLQVCRRGN